MAFDYDIEFTPDIGDPEEARRQRICNMADKYPALKQMMHGKSWDEIYKIPMVRQMEG